METKPYYIPNSLLTTNNKKTMKGEKLGWKTYILYVTLQTKQSRQEYMPYGNIRMLSGLFI